MRHLVITLFFLLISTMTFCQTKNIKISPSKTFQRIDHFTAADAWSGNFVGTYWTQEQKNQIAKWLFSTKMNENGSPEGIGLSLWRVNVGAGTLEQHDADIIPFQRRAESYLTKDERNYDWGKCAGHQFFMEKAVEYGCNNFILFSNSPLVQYTKNGKGWSSSSNQSNIRTDCYEKYAKYLVDVADYYQKKGWNIKYISPINEPQINWDSPRQEGTPWRNSEIKKMFEELDKAITSKGLNNVKMLLGETADLRQLYEESSNLRKRFEGDEAPDKQIQVFFDNNSPFYIGNLKHLPKLIAGHSYHTHSTNALLKETREKLKLATDKYGIDFIQSEWCMLPGQNLNMDGFKNNWIRGNHTNMDVTLLLGRLIYGDFVYANSKAWGYWKGMEVSGDHALISLSLKDGNILNGGNASTNKLLWGMGNYSFFIRPGFVRIELVGADDLNTVAGSAYLSPDKSRIVAVYVNSSYEQHSIKTVFSGANHRKVKNISVYITNENMDLAKNITTYDINTEIFLSPRSLTTVVFDF